MFFVVYRWVSRIDSFFGYTFVLTLCLIRFLGLPLGGLPMCIFWGSYRNPWETLFLYFGRSGQRRPLAGQEHLKNSLYKDFHVCFTGLHGPMSRAVGGLAGGPNG